MNKIHYNIPLMIQIGNQIHLIVQNILLDNQMQRYSNQLSEQQRAKRTPALMYANDLAYLLQSLSAHRKKYKNRLDNLFSIFTKFKLISSKSSKQEQIIQQLNSNLGRLFTLAEKNKKMNEIMEEIMKEGLSSIQNFEMLNVFKENQGQTFFKFMKHLETQTTQMNRENRLALFIKSLLNPEDTKIINESFKALNERQKSFIIPAYNLYLQHQNTLIKIEQQNQKNIVSPLVNKSSNWLKKFIKGSPSKIEQQERLIEKKKQQSINEILEDNRRIQQENDHLKKQFKKIKDQFELKISKLQKNLIILQEKDKKYSILEQQKKKLSFQIKKQKLHFEDYEERIQTFQTDNKRLMSQNEKLNAENNTLRINESLHKKNYQKLELLLQEYENNQKQLQKSLKKQGLKLSQLTNLCEQYKRQIETYNIFKDTQNIKRDDDISSNCTNKRDNQLSLQNSQLRQEIKILNMKMSRLTQSIKNLTKSKEQIIANLQLQLFELKYKLAKT